MAARTANDFVTELIARAKAHGIVVDTAVRWREDGACGWRLLVDPALSEPPRPLGIATLEARFPAWVGLTDDFTLEELLIRLRRWHSMKRAEGAI